MLQLFSELMLVTDNLLSNDNNDWKNHLKMHETESTTSRPCQLRLGLELCFTVHVGGGPCCVADRGHCENYWGARRHYCTGLLLWYGCTITWQSHDSVTPKAYYIYTCTCTCSSRRSYKSHLSTWQSHDSHMTTTWQSHDNHMTITWWSHDSHMTITWQSHDDHMTVTWQSHDSHMMITHDEW